MRNGFLATLTVFVIAGVIGGCASTSNTGTRVLGKGDYERAVASIANACRKLPTKPNYGADLASPIINSIASMPHHKHSTRQPNYRRTMPHRCSIAA